MIEQSETADWPSGLAYRVVDELFKKYRSVDVISRDEDEQQTEIEEQNEAPLVA
jgi:hypothetical protein